MRNPLHNLRPVVQLICDGSQMTFTVSALATARDENKLLLEQRRYMRNETYVTQ